MSSLDRKNRCNRRERNAGKMVIYTEGSVTEPGYLRDWIKNFAFQNSINPIKANQKVRIVPSDCETEPLKIIENLIKREDIKSELDNYYTVFDEDDRSQQGTAKENFNKAFSDAKDNNIKVICSNRSVELWALMYFSDKKPMTKAELEKELQKYLPKYDAITNK